MSLDYPGIKLQIVPFDDTYSNCINILDNLGKNIDVIAGIYPSTLWHRKCSILKITDNPICLAVPRKHRLAAKKELCFADLYGENLIVVERGDTVYIDALRDEIEQNHPEIHIQDAPSYDMNVFNQCEISNSIMLTISTWAEIHPSLVTIPCDWDYSVPYGIVYSTQPSKGVINFIEAIKSILL